MKTIAFSILAFGMLVEISTEANAAACAAGPHRAGCVGPRGAVVTHRHPPYVYHGAAVVRPVPHCYWRAGVRICR